MAIKLFLSKRKTELSIFAVLLILMGVFAAFNPRVFLTPYTYMAVFTVLPIPLMLASSLVFVVACGESDLSFPSAMGVSLWMFALVITRTGYPILGILAAMGAGLLIGLINGILITKVKLSSLVVTLGMNFLLRGLIMIGSNGEGMSLVFLNKTAFYQAIVGKIGMFPVQMIWGLLFMALCYVLFSRHQFGAHVCYIGDNSMSARETGIKVDLVKTLTFMLVGLASAFAGIMSGMINNTFWPTTGDGYLLTTLAAVYLGGTPTWGGVGTIIGSAMGAFILSFLETGIIASGLTGFYTQFFFGLILVLSLISHKFSGMKRRA
ncbi:MAG TPA: ABC transporter permease [Feifaniaceae bacterium]|nr:ABC transporter permease [Feifaniaceae bacterium]